MAYAERTKVPVEKSRLEIERTLMRYGADKFIDAGLTTFEDEFLAQTQLPSGQTVAQWMKPQIQNLMTSGEMPKMLIAGQINEVHDGS